MLLKLASLIISIVALILSVLILFLVGRANYSAKLMTTAYLAEVGHRIIPECVSEAKAKGIHINPFSLIDPNSVSFALEKRVGEKNSHLERVFAFNGEPEKFVSLIRIVVDLSDMRSQVYCAFDPWSGAVHLVGVFSGQQQ